LWLVNLLSPSAVQMTSTAAKAVTFAVTDAGDPVKGAVVKVAGKSGKTDSAGNYLHLPKGLKPAKYQIKASAPDYVAASGKLIVKK
jgi:hypothetical protein